MIITLVALILFEVYLQPWSLLIFDELCAIMDIILSISIDLDGGNEPILVGFILLTLEASLDVGICVGRIFSLLWVPGHGIFPIGWGFDWFAINLLVCGDFGLLYLLAIVYTCWHDTMRHYYYSMLV